jgi:hypothetical protein
MEGSDECLFEIISGSVDGKYFVSIPPLIMWMWGKTTHFILCPSGQEVKGNRQKISDVRRKKCFRVVEISNFKMMYLFTGDYYV